MSGLHCIVKNHITNVTPTTALKNVPGFRPANDAAADRDLVGVVHRRRRGRGGGCLGCLVGGVAAALLRAGGDARRAQVGAQLREAGVGVTGSGGRRRSVYRVYNSLFPGFNLGFNM